MKLEDGAEVKKEEDKEVVTAKDEDGQVIAGDQEIRTTIVKIEAPSPSKPSLGW